MADPALPLAGIKVLDLSRLLPGPYATLVLSDLGAQVDKVEEPSVGDYLRLFPPLVDFSGKQAGAPASAEFHALNRDKRSLALDLKDPRGAQVLLRLLPRYDVLVETFRPGVLDRLGLGVARLHAQNPRLVVCSITGYGQTGPMSRRAGHDVNYLARAGVLGLTGPADGTPSPFGGQVADVGGSLWAVIGIQAALVERERTLRGKHVDISMTEASATFAVTAFARALAGTPVSRGADLLTGGIAPYGVYATKDGALMSLGALEPKFWFAFCEAVEMEPDPMAVLPGPHQAELALKVARIFASRTRADWEQFFFTRDVCCEPVLSPEEALDEPQARHRESTFEAFGLRMQRTPLGRTTGHRPAPRLGEHTDRVLGDAGFTSAEVEVLRAAKVVA